MSIRTPRASLVDEIAERIPDAPAGVGPSRDEIAAVVATIVERFRPERVVLFGSRVYGQPRDHSDVDLMVVVESPLSNRAQGNRIAEVLPRGSFTPDVNVRTPAQIRRALAERDFFIEDVMLKGITLYGGGSMASADGQGGDDGPGDILSRPKRATLAWVRKAEEDYRSATVLLALPDPLTDIACFHAQQCVEKYLKAFLQEREINFPRTHELGELADHAVGALAALVPLRRGLDQLTKCAVAIRYPDDVDLGTPSEEVDAEGALRLATEVRALVRVALGLDEATATR